MLVINTNSKTVYLMIFTHQNTGCVSQNNFSEEGFKAVDSKRLDTEPPTFACSLFSRHKCNLNLLSRRPEFQAVVLTAPLNPKNLIRQRDQT